jgi:hypothetical protein
MSSDSYYVNRFSFVQLSTAVFIAFRRLNGSLGDVFSAPNAAHTQAGHELPSSTKAGARRLTR